MIYAALAMGFLGSLHCIGMCGPIALALPYGRYGGFKAIMARSLYQIGRLSTYAIMGLILGLLGMSLEFVNGQQFLSIGIGVVLLLSIAFPLLFHSIKTPAFIDRINSSIRKTFARFVQINNVAAIYLTGMLNGLLPCGLVWLALASALALGNGVESSAFMLMFGLGTLPAMLGIVFSYQALKNKFRFSFNRLAKIVTICLGIILIVRGLNMGNHLSPYFNFDEAKKTIITVCGLDS